MNIELISTNKSWQSLKWLCALYTRGSVPRKGFADYINKFKFEFDYGEEIQQIGVNQDLSWTGCRIFVNIIDSGHLRTKQEVHIKGWIRVW